MAVLDFLILAAFVAYAIFTGFGARKVASENLEEYFLAGRSLKGWQAGMSMAATQFAADTPLLVTGLIATAGIFSLWRLWVYALAFLMLGFLLAPCWRRAGVLTDAALTEFRYSGRPAALLRGIKALYYGTAFNCMVLAIVLLAATRIAEPFLLWHQWLPPTVYSPVFEFVTHFELALTVGVPGQADVWLHSANNLISIMVIVLVTTLYSTTGGLRSVVATDIVQLTLMMIGTFLFAWVVVAKVGGLGELTHQLETLFAKGGPNGMTAKQLLAFTPSHAKDAGVMVLMMMSVQWLVQANADGTGYLAQRSMACRTDQDARQAAVIFTVLQIVLRSLLWLPIGLGLLVLFPPDVSMTPDLLRAEREATFVRGMAELLPVGVKGLMVTGMLAALASTVDTHLNWGASYWTNDIYKRFLCQGLLKKEPSPTSLVWVARLANLLILAIALFIMTHLSSIQTTWRASLLLSSGLGLTLVLRWFWWRLNGWGELATIVASMILAPILLTLIPEGGDALRVLCMAMGCTLVAVLVSWATSPEPMANLQVFYQKVRPPGFWRPVAMSLNEPADGVKRLQKGMVAMGVTALSVFCLLTGFGSWLCGSPAPVWFPWPGPWVVLLLLCGLGLVRVWWPWVVGYHQADNK